MGWEIGESEGRDIGYGVPSTCDHPECNAKIFRGLAEVCGGMHDSSDRGCGQYFCSKHLTYKTINEEEDDGEQVCEACAADKEPFPKKPDTKEWMLWKLRDESWEKWRQTFPEKVEELKRAVESA